MRDAAFLTKSGLSDWLVRLARQTRLMAPTKRGRQSFAFAWVDDPREVAIDYVRTILPPKQAFLPAREKLLDFRLRPVQESTPAIEDEPFVLFGIHPCDLAAIGQLDWAMTSRHSVPDPHYIARRKAGAIIGVECQPDEYCFCTSVGTSGTREGADLFLTPANGGYLTEVLTPRGEELLQAAPSVREASPEERAVGQGWAAEKQKRCTCRLVGEMAEWPDRLEARYESEVWDRTASRCYSCGTCTSVCPTCFCFDVWDEVNIGLTAGTRQRRYDSCQLQDFALVAGPQNFRGERTDRVRHRWLRKFVYLMREYGKPFCVGCGRCTTACTADISLTDVLNAVLAETEEVAS